MASSLDRERNHGWWEEVVLIFPWWQYFNNPLQHSQDSLNFQNTYTLMISPDRPKFTNEDAETSHVFVWPCIRQLVCGGVESKTEASCFSVPGLTFPPAGCTDYSDTRFSCWYCFWGLWGPAWVYRSVSTCLTFISMVASVFLPASLLSPLSFPSFSPSWSI